MLKITLDTNQIGDRELPKIKGALIKLKADVATISVTDREIRGSSIKSFGNVLLETGVWDESHWDNMVWANSITEDFILGESELGKAQLGSNSSKDTFEEVLKIITGGTFPKAGNREQLSPGQRNQLRDAMILEAHIREKRDILISDDKKAFIGHDGSHRQILESKFGIKIMTSDEFVTWANSYSKDLPN